MSDYLQSFTYTISYRIISDVICGFLFIALIINADATNRGDTIGLNTFLEYQNLLAYMRSVNFGKLYLQDENIFMHINKTYINVY